MNKPTVRGVPEGTGELPKGRRAAEYGTGAALPRRSLLFLLAAAAIMLGVPAAAADVAVSLSEQNGIQHIQGSFETPVSSAAAWAVLTDYVHLPEFVSSMQEARVLAHSPGRSTVEQVAAAHFFLFKRTVHLTLDIAEIPDASLLFRDVAHKDFSSYEGSWNIEPVAAGCRVSYDLKARLSTLLPEAVLKGIFQRQAAELLKAVRLEMSKRSPKEE